MILNGPGLYINALFKKLPKKQDYYKLQNILQPNYETAFPKV